jgi:lysozyme
MTDIARLRAALRIDEGDKSKPYKDTRALWTICTGRCLETNPLTGAEWKFLLDRGLIKVEISQEGDDYLLDTDLASSLKQCAARFEFWPTLNDARQNALAEMAFNLGIDKLCEFKKMIDAMRQSNWQLAAQEGLNSLWAKQVGERAARLMKLLEFGQFEPTNVQSAG